MKEQLLPPITEGLPDDLARLVLEHYPGVYRMALALLRNTHDAKELCQDAFLRACENIRRFDPSRPFKTWSYTIAYRLVLERIRRDRIARRALADAPRRPSPPPEAADLAHMAEKLDAVIHTLDPEDQMLLHYRFREGLRFAEIAQIAESTETAVRVRFFRLLERIRSDFREMP